LPKRLFAGVGKNWHGLAVSALSILAMGWGTAHAFDCSEEYCSRLSNCAEAHYKFTVCRQSIRDRDDDGIPCENLCGKTLPEYHRRLREQGVDPSAPAQALLPSEVPPPEQFACAGKRRCGQMHSCAEARFYLNNCGVRSLDRDRDGVPCESICGD
jgi:Excalibur calcium-binding domain